jgi:hypothetical protein
VAHPKSIRELVNQTGTVSVSGLFSFDVSFDLLELPHSTHGVGGKLYTYGRLKFHQELEPSSVSMLLTAARLTLKGGGIEVSIFLHGRNSFGIVGPIKDVEHQSTSTAIR